MVPYRIRSASCVMLSLITLTAASACGSSVTGPAPVSNVQGSGPSTGAPPGGTNPTAPTPTPSPTPTPTPTPTPAPAPVPTPPAGGSVERFDARTEFAYWGPPSAPRLFGDTFVIELSRGRGEIVLHNTRLAIATTTTCCLIAQSHPSTGVTYRFWMDVERGEWRLEGDAQATGTMRRQ